MICFGYGGPLQARTCAPQGPAQGPEAYSVGCILATVTRSILFVHQRFCLI